MNRPIELGDDGQLLVNGLHDSRLTSIRFSPGEEVSMEFQTVDVDERLVVRIDPIARPVVWAESVVFPMIVARLSLFKPAFGEQTAARVDPGAFERLQGSVMPTEQPDWVLLVEPILGDFVGILGYGEAQSVIEISA